RLPGTPSVRHTARGATRRGAGGRPGGATGKVRGGETRQGASEGRLVASPVARGDAGLCGSGHGASARLAGGPAGTPRRARPTRVGRRGVHPARESALDRRAGRRGRIPA